MDTSRDAEQEIRAELIGAPPRLRELQAKAQEVHKTLLADELKVVYGDAGVTATWQRGARIEGTGPTPAYYYDFTGCAVTEWTGA